MGEIRRKEIIDNEMADTFSRRGIALGGVRKGAPKARGYQRSNVLSVHPGMVKESPLPFKNELRCSASLAAIARWSLIP
jgi:hypothetical protein